MADGDPAPGNDTATAGRDDPAAVAAVLCPACGYDVRSAPSGRCSECGLALDGSAAAESHVPWARRRKAGRVRAFVRTVWAVTLDRRPVRHELARPQEPRDAARFRWANAACVAAALGVAAAVAHTKYGPGAIAVEPFAPFMIAGRAAPMAGYQQDAAVPWCAGATFSSAVPFYLIGLAAYLTGMGRSMVRLRGYPPEHRERAAALARYAAAPLAWLVPAAALYAVAYGMRHGGQNADKSLSELAEGLAGLVAAAAVGLASHRAGQWHARSAHGGPGRYAAGVVEWVGRLLLGLVLFLGVVPWCVGLVRVIVDAL